MKLILVGLILAVMELPTHAGALWESTFDTSSSGWTSESFFADLNDDHPVFTDALQSYAVTWAGTGGNPGATISETDQDGGWQYFSAPSELLGDESAALGGTLSFDLERTDGNTDFPPQAGPPLAITDGKTVLVFSDPNVTLPTNGEWTTYSFDLSAASGGIFVTSAITGAEATQKQLDKVLSDLTGLYILGDWYTGIGDAYNLDNVELTAGPSSNSQGAGVPEPGTWGMVLAGGLGLVWLRGKKPLPVVAAR